MKEHIKTKSGSFDKKGNFHIVLNKTISCPGKSKNLEDNKISENSGEIYLDLTDLTISGPVVDRDIVILKSGIKINEELRSSRNPNVSGLRVVRYTNYNTSTNKESLKFFTTDLEINKSTNLTIETNLGSVNIEHKKKILPKMSSNINSVNIQMSSKHEDYIVSDETSINELPVPLSYRTSNNSDNELNNQSKLTIGNKSSEVIIQYLRKIKDKLGKIEIKIHKGKGDNINNVMENNNTKTSNNLIIKKYKCRKVNGKLINCKNKNLEGNEHCDFIPNYKIPSKKHPNGVSRYQTS